MAIIVTINSDYEFSDYECLLATVHDCSWLFMTVHDYWLLSWNLEHFGARYVFSYSPPGKPQSPGPTWRHCSAHCIRSSPFPWLTCKKIYGKSTDPPIILVKLCWRLIHRSIRFGDKSMEKMEYLCGCVWKCCAPLNPMVLLIIIPIKWLFHWEYTPFSDKPMSVQFW